MSDTLRLLLVARRGPLTKGLLALLATIPGIKVIGPVDDVPLGPAAVSKLGAAAVILDPAGSSAEQTSDMVRRWVAEGAGSRSIRCVVLAGDVRQQRAAERAGADAVLLQGCPPTELVATVRGLLGASQTPQSQRITTQGGQWR